MSASWTSVDDHLTSLLVGPDPVLDGVLAANQAAGLPSIDVTPMQGKLLMLLCRAAGARTVLEIGTLGGYSAIWLCRGLPDDGHLVTLDVDARHADVARANLERAGLRQRIDQVLGPAVETLPTLGGHPAVPFDLVFIDADKQNTPRYLELALDLSHPGTLVVCDNVVRAGQVALPTPPDERVAGMQAFVRLLGEHPRIDATVIQTVGAKGWDGFALGVVRD